VRIGTRLTVVLLLCVMPVLAAYTYWSVEQSNVYTNELKQSARAVTSGVAPAVDEEVIAQEWNKIGDTFRKLNAEGTRSALLHKDGTLWYSLPDFPADAVAAARVQLAQRKSEEFGPTTGARSWFCELVPLKGESGHVIGYLLEVQDWTKAARDIQAQSIASVIVAIVLPYFFASPLAILPPSVGDWLLRVTPAAAFAIQQAYPRYPQVLAAYTPQNGYYPLTAWLGLAVLAAWTAAALALAGRNA